MSIKGITGIHHVAISVPSLEKAQAFYCEVLGMERISRWDFEASSEGDAVLALNKAEAKTLILAAGNIYLEVFEFTSPEAMPQDTMRPLCDHGYTHLAFEVEDIQAVYEALELAGVRWHHTPIEAGEGYWMTYGRDPFGNVIEIQQVDPEAEFHIQRLRHWQP